MRFKTIYLLLFILTYCFSSCSLKDHVIPVEPDIYVAGNSKENGVFSAKYWKNGSELQLMQSEYDISTTGIAVSDNDDVHVIGIMYKDQVSSGLYWRNGKKVDFSDGAMPFYLYDIKAVGNDVYLAGSIPVDNISFTHVAIWKNGIPALLEKGDIGWASGIQIVGEDVYVAGNSVSKDDANQNMIARYWKNGVAVDLTDGTKSAYATGIAVSGTDVHVVGFQADNNSLRPKYWKNGIEVPLKGWDDVLYVNGIAVVGNEVIIVGNTVNGKATYWKNGSVHDLSPSGFPWAVTVSNNNIYVAGISNEKNGKAVYWKNGRQVDLSNGSYSQAARAICVVNR